MKSTEYFFSANCLIKLNYVPSSLTISLTILKLLSGQNFHTDISNEPNSAKSVGGVMVLYLPKLSDNVLYLYQVS